MSDVRDALEALVDALGPMLLEGSRADREAYDAAITRAELVLNGDDDA